MWRKRTRTADQKCSETPDQTEATSRCRCAHSVCTLPNDVRPHVAGFHGTLRFSICGWSASPQRGSLCAMRLCVHHLRSDVEAQATLSVFPMAPQLLASGAHISRREAPELGEASRGAPLPPPTLPPSHLQDVCACGTAKTETQGECLSKIGNSTPGLDNRREHGGGVESGILPTSSP